MRGDLDCSLLSSHPSINLGRYCSASARCADWKSSLPAKSAIVRASFTLRVRWYARADKFNWLIAAGIRLWPSSWNWQNFRIFPIRISALEMIFDDSVFDNRGLEFVNRACWIFWTACILARMNSDDSLILLPLIFSYPHAVLRCGCAVSILSSSGPEIRFWYLVTIAGAGVELFPTNSQPGGGYNKRRR